MRGAVERGRPKRRSTATAAAVDLLEVQIERIDQHADRNDAWASESLRRLKLGVLRALNDVVVSLDAVGRGEVVGEDLEDFVRACADGANYFAFLAERARRATASGLGAGESS